MSDHDSYSDLNRDLGVLDSISLQFQNAKTQADIRRSLIASATFPEGALQRGERASGGQYGMFASARWPVS